MVVAVRISPPVKGKVPKLSMMELVSVANKRYRVSKLRKSRGLPHGYCYTCSCIDPSGLFRNPHSHLYRRGFLHTCEHLPKPPNTTFIADDNEFTGNDVNGEDRYNSMLCNLQKDSLPAPSIAITVHRPLSSASLQLPSKAESDLFSNDSITKSKASRNGSQTERLPTENRLLPVITTSKTTSTAQFTQKSEIQSKQVAASKLNSSKSTNDSGLGTLNRTINTTRTVPSPKSSAVQTLPHSVDRITIIPTCNMDEGTPTTEASTVPVLTPNSVSPVKTGTDKDDIELRTDPIDIPVGLLSTGDEIPRKHSIASYNGGWTKPIRRALPSSRSLPERVRHGLPVITHPVINQSDGLQHPVVAQVLLQESVRLLEPHETGIKPVGASLSKRLLPEPPAPTSTRRPGSGRLRYHHRCDEDTVPFPGFHIPPTPTSDSLYLAQSETSSMSSGTLPYSDTGSSFEDDNDNPSLSSNKRKQRRKRRQKLLRQSSQIPEQQNEKGRNPTEAGEISTGSIACGSCGKGSIGSATHSGSSKHSRAGVGDTTTSKARQQAMHAGSGTERRRTKGDNAMIKGEYPENDSIIDDDDEYGLWSDDDERFPPHFDETKSWYRNGHAQNCPEVSPDIHKRVYTQALEAAQIKEMLKNDDFIFDGVRKIRRPNVFSYIPLLPNRDIDKLTSTAIGLKAEVSDKPKKGQYMKHIFGDVNPDNFYAVKPTRPKPLVIEDTFVDTLPSELSPFKTTQSINDKDRSSVSLKMRRPEQH